jgi:hypothetical protein
MDHPRSCSTNCAKVFQFPEKGDPLLCDAVVLWFGEEAQRFLAPNAIGDAALFHAAVSFFSAQEIKLEQHAI